MCRELEPLRRNTTSPRCMQATRRSIADPDLDAVYNPLPNGLHGRWTRAALAAGKHVLCEKPFTANAAEAREIAELAAKSDRVVMEAFHYRYHPLALRIEQIIASGELGELQRVEAVQCFPPPKFSDIRYNYSLAGGSTMDAGCYVGPHGSHVWRGQPRKSFRRRRNCASLRSTGP